MYFLYFVLAPRGVAVQPQSLPLTYSGSIAIPETYRKRKLDGDRIAKVEDLKNSHYNGVSSSLNGANSKQKLQ